MNKKQIKRTFYGMALLVMILSMPNLSSQQVSETNPSASAETITVLPGESTVLNQPFTVTRVSVGSPDVISATQTTSSEILVNGIAPGKTNLIIWGDAEQRVDYEVIVPDERGLSEIAEELSNLLANIDGITVKTIGARNVIEGTVYSGEELTRINKVLESYPGVINLAQTGEIYNKLLAEEIKKTIGIDGVDVRYTKSGYVLDGIVLSEFEAKYAQQIAESFTEKVISALYINPNLQTESATSQIVRLDLKIIEVSTDKFANKINDFTVGFDSAASASDSESDLQGNITITDPDLRRLAEDSDGRVLVEQSVVVESKKTANVFVGDEVPIPVQQGGNGGLSVEYRDVGLSIDVTPMAYDDQTVNLDVKLTSSNVTGQAITGGPELSTARVTTAARIASELNVVFAGLISQRDARDFVGNAGNPKKSKKPNRFTDDRREILVMIKPKILKSLDNTMPEMKRAVERSYKDYDIRKNAQD